VATKAQCPVDFDHHLLTDPQGTYETLRAEAPVSWSENHGGYWVVTGYEEVVHALDNPEIFSSQLQTGPNGEPQAGLFIPADKALVPMIPAETDPPDWRPYRMLLTKRFTKTAVEAMRPMVEEIVARRLGEVLPAGRCDMVLDLAGPIPASGMLRLMGLDEDEWAFYAEPFHNSLGYPVGTPEFEEAVAGLQNIVERIHELVRERRENPGDDLISAIATADIEGELIAEDNATGVVYTLFSGGVDTTTSFLANAFAYFSRNPAEREYLQEDLSRIEPATEELLRWNTPVQALGRTVMTETTLGGQEMAPGERVLLSFASANLDDGAFAEAGRCALDRSPNKHLGFGKGIHKCLGAHFARVQIEITLTEVLTKMPDYVIDEESSRYPNIGIVNGWLKMPATFTPTPEVAQ
jgi:cytochrome P450